MDSHANKPLKIVLLGDEGVGKTALLVRFLCRRYLGEYDPTIEDSYSKKITVDGKSSIIEVLDTSEKGFGTSRRKDFMSAAHAFIIVFSTTNHESFKSVTKHKSTIEQYPGQSKVPIGLIGTKSDLTHLRQVTRNDGQTVATSNGWLYSECSAAYDINIQSVFDKIVRRIRGDADVNTENKIESKKLRRKTSLFNKISSQFTRRKSSCKSLQIPIVNQENQNQVRRTRVFSTAAVSQPQMFMGRRRSYSVTTFM